MRLPVFVCLFVCLFVCPLARLLNNACVNLNEMLRVDRCRDMDELINLWASVDTRNFTSGKSDVYVLPAAARRGFKMVLRPTAAATGGFTVVLLTEPVSRRNTFVGGTTWYMRSTECPSSYSSQNS